MLISTASCATSSPSQVKKTTYQPQQSPCVTLQLQWWQLFSSPVFNSSDLTHSWDKQDVIFCLTRVSGEAALYSSYALDEILLSAFPIPVCWCLIRGPSCSRTGVWLYHNLTEEPAEGTLLARGAWFSLPECFTISDNLCCLVWAEIVLVCISVF